MKRITNPLTEMGAKIKTKMENYLYILRFNFKNSKIQIDIPSAQIKSGLILQL